MRESPAYLLYIIICIYEGDMHLVESYPRAPASLKCQHQLELINSRNDAARLLSNVLTRIIAIDRERESQRRFN